jgi:hypothetical protein
MSTMTETWASVETVAAKLIEFLETNTLVPGLFAGDLFADVTVPQWRLQANSPEGMLAIRLGGHPYSGKVPRHRLDATERGFVLEVEETWTDDAGEKWYCREMLRADVGNDGLIHRLSVYCTGDWDSAQVARHRSMVDLIRP